MSDNDDTSAYSQHPEGQMEYDHGSMVYDGENFLEEPVDYQSYNYEAQFEHVQLNQDNVELMEYVPYEPLQVVEEPVFEAREGVQDVSDEVKSDIHVELAFDKPYVPSPSATEISKPKGSSKRKTDPNGKSYCETLVDKSVATPEQLKAIECIGTERGMIQMNNWLTTASLENDVKRLCNLLAQCYHAEVTVALLSAGETPKTVRQLRKFGNKNVQRAANEVYKKWLYVVQHDVKKTSAAKIAAPAAKTHVPKGVSIATNPLDLLDAEDEPAPTPQPIKRPSLKARPKTARTKQTKFRLTGFEEDAEDQAALVTMPVKTLQQKPGSVSSRPATNAIPPSHAPAVVSDAFANALAASAGPSLSTKVIRKTQSSIRPSAPPIIPAPSMAVPSSSDSSLSVWPDKYNVGINGPDPSRVPQPGQPRRIHFADDKNLDLIKIRYIPGREDANNHMHSQKDMQHADAEQERLSMASLKRVRFDEEEDDDIGGTLNEPEPLITEILPKKKRYIYVSKRVTRKTDHALYREEEERKQQTLAFFAPAGAIRDMVATPERYTTYAYTNDCDDMVQLFCTSKKLPVETNEEMAQVKNDIPKPFVKVVDEPMDVVESPASPSPKKVVFEPEIGIIEDFDIHSAHASKPKGPNVAILTPDIRNILLKLKANKEASTSAAGPVPIQHQPQVTTQPLPPISVRPSLATISRDSNIVEVPIDIHSGRPSVVPPIQMTMLTGPRPPFRPMNFGGGFRPRAPVVPCRFFAQGRCSKGPHCPFPHTVLPPTATAPSPMRNASSRNYEPTDDDYHRGGRDYHRNRGRDLRDDRSPPPRRTLRRSPSPLRELRERRRRHSDSRSPDRGNSRRRRRSPSFDRHRERSRSRSPIPSRSPSPHYD